jgi:putative alpha-1,2-mannosidase
MSAWLVFSMIGLYPVCPATGQYITTIPAFDEVIMHLSGNKLFRINTTGRNDTSFKLEAATLNGRKFSRNYLTHKDITDGGILNYKISK